MFLITYREQAGVCGGKEIRIGAAIEIVIEFVSCLFHAHARAHDADDDDDDSERSVAKWAREAILTELTH